MAVGVEHYGICMMIVQLENGWIGIPYERGSDPFVWRDMISGPADQINAMTDAELAAEMDRRYQDWLTLVQGG